MPIPENPVVHERFCVKRALRRLHLVLVVVSLALLLLGALWHVATRPVFREVYLDLDDAVPRYDVYLTWTGWSGYGGEDLSGIVYDWNGSEQCHGKAGLQRVLDLLSALPEGSRVLIYPRYETVWEYAQGVVRDYPWVEGGEYMTLIGIARSRKLTLIYSSRDHAGQVHPQAFESYESHSRAVRSQLPADSAKPENGIAPGDPRDEDVTEVNR